MTQQEAAPLSLSCREPTFLDDKEDSPDMEFNHPSGQDEETKEPEPLDADEIATLERQYTGSIDQ